MIYAKAICRMTKNKNFFMYLLIIAFPLLGSLFAGFFGRLLGIRGWSQQHNFGYLFRLLVLFTVHYQNRGIRICNICFFVWVPKHEKVEERIANVAHFLKIILCSLNRLLFFFPVLSIDPAAECIYLYVGGCKDRTATECAAGVDWHFQTLPARTSKQKVTVLTLEFSPLNKQTNKLTN